MTFGDKIRGIRLKENLTQEEFGRVIGVSKRSIINYESGKSFPLDTGVYGRIAELFGVTIDYLLTEQDEFSAKAYAEGGMREKRIADTLIAEASALFAGGTLSQEDKDAVILALQEAYWIAKHENKKFVPKAKGKKHEE